MKVTDKRWWAREEGAPEAGEEPKLKPKYVEELEQRIAEKDLEIQQLLAKYRGASDEFEQARARLRKELSKDVERGRRQLILSFIDVLDNFDRALDAVGERAAGDQFVQGISMVRQQFLATLEGFGVRRMVVEGGVFDPELHEGVTTISAPSPDQAGTIAGVIRSGYSIGEEVLRPAQVAVFSAP